jgi:hypothetical protein
MKKQLPCLYEKMVTMMKKQSIDGTLSHSDLRELLSWMHLSKKDAKKAILEMRDMKIIKLGNRGVKIIINEEDCPGFREDGHEVKA